MSEIEDLVNHIKYLATAYYFSSNPICSDEYFDLLVEELKDIDPHNSLLTPVKISESPTYIK